MMRSGVVVMMMVVTMMMRLRHRRASEHHQGDRDSDKLDHKEIQLSEVGKAHIG
jgi:hypothetical protein